MDIEEGRRFLEVLKGSGVPLNAAWWQNELLIGWQLLLVTPLVDQLGLKKTYRKLDDILSKVPERPAIDLLNVSVFTPQSAFFKSLHRVFRNAKNLPVSRQPVGDHLIDEGFIYFVK
jgi:hypothetical protein